GPLMYLGFLSFRLDQRNLTTALVIHLSAPVVVLAVFHMLVGDLRALDWVISASYLFYMCALFLLWRRGPDALICAPVGRTNSLSNWMLRALGLLVFVFLLDTTIALDFELNKGAHVATLISYGTLPLIAASLVVLLTLPAMLAPSGAKPRATHPADRQDAEVEERLCKLLTDEQLFLDPDLTVQRLAKRLHLPARDVSAAVNRCKGLNVSQYVNEFRVAHAATLMSSSADSITKIAQRSGFLSRSNFYREFQRVFDQSPTEFRTSRPKAETGSKSD
ncbi:MAG: AraC family transcriptional regulator, partial [Pseudomonadota bacterium]